ncbi:MAG: DUF1080 domain-containing protein, partial [Pirellulaceae bacterium]|nr:DUF1080 domain-containing protein [Pirellulaceae bacterium]
MHVFALARWHTGLACCLSMSALLVSCAYGEDQPNQLSVAEQRSGWRLLFDGKTSQGWRNYRQDKISEGWKVEDGALVRVASKAGDIITVEQFGNFELTLEYKVEVGGNSGIMFHVTEEGKRAWHTGPEIQVLDNELGGDQQKAGWLYQLYKASLPDWAISFARAVGREAPDDTDATRPAGQWNQVYLRVADQGEVIVNGVHYFYFEKGSEDWNERVAKSKFAKYPKFGKAKKGHICLQDHGDRVAFRNIKVRGIAADGSAPDSSDGDLPVGLELAFPDLVWEDWSPEDDRGRLRSLRIVELTHAGDDSGRLFAAAQNGAIQSFANRKDVTQATMFLDLRSKVVQWNENPTCDEYGLLGLAFHPDYEKNGQLFVSYNSLADPHTSYVSRFVVSESDPDRADPDSEQVLLRLEQ